MHFIAKVCVFFYYQVGTLNVKGGGILHAVHLDITADKMKVDDLGQVIGDTHSVTCSSGEGIVGSNGASGAGHGGRGGRGNSAKTTGAPYGQLFDPSSKGCKGGDGSSVTDSGGSGGGVIYLTVTDTLHNDGRNQL